MQTSKDELASPWQFLVGKVLSLETKPACHSPASHLALNLGGVRVGTDLLQTHAWLTLIRLHALDSKRLGSGQHLLLADTGHGDISFGQLLAKEITNWQ